MNAQRAVHPTIAPLALPAGTVAANLASPYVAIPDGQWNYGEGFTASAGQPDRGGWHGEDVGAFVTEAHVRPSFNMAALQWAPYTWNDNRSPASPVAVLRLVGCLRPPGSILPDFHPLYGSLSPQRYVDQAAFEMFMPNTLPTPQQQTIVICIMCEATTAFPKQHDDKNLAWRHIYPGIFSPDGLVRRERFGANPPSAAEFLNNTDPHAVERPVQLRTCAEISE